SLSVLAAAYAVLLVAAGVFQRNATTRVLGVALIAFVVLKLYLYDVWLLGQFYRIAAFAIHCLLLLLMSYFYSRFRRSMESWRRPKPTAAIARPPASTMNSSSGLGSKTPTRVS